MKHAESELSLKSPVALLGPSTIVPITGTQINFHPAFSSCWVKVKDRRKEGEEMRKRLQERERESEQESERETSERNTGKRLIERLSNRERMSVRERLKV